VCRLSCSSIRDARTCAHPAINLMENFTNNAIGGLQYQSGTPYSDWYIDDLTMYKANGEVIHSGKKAWVEGLPSTYGPFKAHLHDPDSLSCYETKDGWDMIGQVDVYTNLHIEGSEPKVKDSSGKEWDVVTPAAFHFQYVKDSKANHDGIRLKSTKILCNSGPAHILMLKREHLKPADHGQWLETKYTLGSAYERGQKGMICNSV